MKINRADLIAFLNTCWVPDDGEDSKDSLFWLMIGERRFAGVEIEPDDSGEWGWIVYRMACSASLLYTPSEHLKRFTELGRTDYSTQSGYTMSAAEAKDAANEIVADWLIPVLEEVLVGLDAITNTDEED